MSNTGIRELKRKQKRQRRARRKKVLLRSGIGAVIIAAAFNFGFNKSEDEFQIKRPTDLRQASANYTLPEEEDVSVENDKIHVATQIGFNDIEIDKSHQIEDSGYSDILLEYVMCEQTQYAYQFPNDYSRTEKYVSVGEYIPYYGTENGFSKVKIDDTYYYVNKFGLSKIDKENQIKVVNGIPYVSENYILPKDFNPGVDKTARRAFETMRQDLQRDGMDLKIASDYRGYDLEEKMFNVGEPDSSAPGTSEHQLGLAFDFFTEGTKYNDKFEKTAEYKWLSENAYKYGFIERYPKDKENKTNHEPEARHFRFVGVENAKEIYENDLTLEEYLKIN